MYIFIFRNTIMIIIFWRQDIINKCATTFMLQITNFQNTCLLSIRNTIRLNILSEEFIDV